MYVDQATKELAASAEERLEPGSDSPTLDVGVPEGSSAAAFVAHSSDRFPCRLAEYVLPRKHALCSKRGG